MWIDKALPYGADILLSAYAVYLFFYYFDIFFARKKSKKLWVAGLTEFVLWQFGISTIISLPAYVNIAVTVIVHCLQLRSLMRVCGGISACL